MNQQFTTYTSHLVDGNEDFFTHLKAPMFSDGGTYSEVGTTTVSPSFWEVAKEQLKGLGIVLFVFAAIILGSFAH